MAQPTWFTIDTLALLKGMFAGAWVVIKAFWPLWILLLVVATLRLIFDRLGYEFDHFLLRRKTRRGAQWRSDRDLLLWLRRLHPTAFEEYIAELFTKLGYTSRAVGGGYDGGIDVIAEKDGVAHYIQCKKFITQEVGVGAMRDFYGALADHVANGKGFFITTNRFTLEAERFAADKPIELIDGFRLVEYIRSAEQAPTMPSPSSSTPAQCPECSGALVERTGKYGRFFGCANYPQCRYTRAAA